MYYEYIFRIVKIKNILVRNNTINSTEEEKGRDIFWLLFDFARIGLKFVDFYYPRSRKWSQKLILKSILEDGRRDVVK